MKVKGTDRSGMGKWTFRREWRLMSCCRGLSMTSGAMYHNMQQSGTASEIIFPHWSRNKAAEGAVTYAIPEIACLLTRLRFAYRSGVTSWCSTVQRWSQQNILSDLMEYCSRADKHDKCVRFAISQSHLLGPSESLDFRQNGEQQFRRWKHLVGK